MTGANCIGSPVAECEVLKVFIDSGCNSSAFWEPKGGPLDQISEIAEMRSVSLYDLLCGVYTANWGLRDFLVPDINVVIEAICVAHLDDEQKSIRKRSRGGKKWDEVGRRSGCSVGKLRFERRLWMKCNKRRQLERSN